MALLGAHEAMGLAIKHRMLILGLNQGSLSELVGMHRTALSHRINGRTSLDLQEISDIAEAMGVRHVRSDRVGGTHRGLLPHL